jgi:hypothetical protein
VAGVRQVNHLVIDMSWATVDDSLPLMVQYDNEYLPTIRFAPYAEADEEAPPSREYVSLRGEEFLSVLVWLIRQGLLEDVGLVSTETAPSVRATHASPVPVETHSCLCTLEPVREAERIQAIAEWGIEQERARMDAREYAGCVRGGDSVEDDDEIDMDWDGYFYERERTETSTESGDTQRLVTMVAEEASVDDVRARHASPVQEGESDDDDPFGGEYDLVEGAGDPSWLELPTVMRHLHHDQELSVTDIARVCGTTYARVKGALKRLGIERRSYRGGRSKIAPHTESGCTAQ